MEDYTVSDDGLTYDFTLRSGVTFSDGTPLTANDVKYTFTRMPVSYTHLPQIQQKAVHHVP